MESAQVTIHYSDKSQIKDVRELSLGVVKSLNEATLGGQEGEYAAKLQKRTLQYLQQTFSHFKNSINLSLDYNQEKRYILRYEDLPYDESVHAKEQQARQKAIQSTQKSQQLCESVGRELESSAKTLVRQQLRAHERQSGIQQVRLEQEDPLAYEQYAQQLQKRILQKQADRVVQFLVQSEKVDELLQRQKSVMQNQLKPLLDLRVLKEKQLLN